MRTSTEVARNLFESAKAGNDRTLGEKAIGILDFQQLATRCDIVSRAMGNDDVIRGCHRSAVAPKSICMSEPSRAGSMTDPGFASATARK